MQAGAGASKRIAIICQPDNFANGIKPGEMKRFLEKRGHEVSVLDTSRLSRSSRWSRHLGGNLPSLQPRRAALYANGVAQRLLTRRWKFGRHHLSYYVLVADQILRQAILKASLELDDFDLVVCEEPYDAGVLAVPTTAATLYDCPCPWADELYFEGRLTEQQHVKLRHREKELFDSVDSLSFHWPSYAAYAVENYGIRGHNLMRLDFGCTPAEHRLEFASPPRIVYLGNLSARFNNPSLLARLAQQYPHIDVYGGPPPDPGLGLNYLGYSPSLDVLHEYQLGLVTCSTDILRQNGFSSKHTNYLAYGLPVLVPEWRRHLELLQGSIPYTEATFLSRIRELSDEKRWRAASDEAYAQAQRLAWDVTLRPLEELLRSLAR
jgi:hypothetical protein